MWQTQTSKLPQQEIKKMKKFLADANVQTTTAGNQKEERTCGRRKRPNYHSRKSQRRKNMWQTQTSKLPQQEIKKLKAFLADANVQTTTAGNQIEEKNAADANVQTTTVPSLLNLEIVSGSADQL